MSIEDLIVRLAADWKTPRTATHHGEVLELPLRCTVKAGPARNVPVEVPEKLADLWRITNGARLFEDVTYGQWGLFLLSPDQAKKCTARFRRERSNDHITGDLVIGEFRGDQDLLVIRADPDAADFGKVQVVLPIYRRRDAYDVGTDLEVFLEAFARAHGAKFWEAGLAS